MARKKSGRKQNDESAREKSKKYGRPAVSISARPSHLYPETQASIWAIALIGVGLILALAGWHTAGPVGELLFRALDTLLGWGYFMLPLSLFLVGTIFLFPRRQSEGVVGMTFIGAGLMLLSALGLIDLAVPGKGGWLGFALGVLKVPFGRPAAVIIVFLLLTIAVLTTLNVPLKIRWPFTRKDKETTEEEENDIPIISVTGKKSVLPQPEDKATAEPVESAAVKTRSVKTSPAPSRKFTNYVPPPLSLLKSAIEHPTTGDLRGNANIIKRTLEGFGIAVEMGEINIGPKVTRYTLKPAEGMKLSRITGLNQDLALALAAHPIRIEAPIPGKSLVGIEVPNKAAATVRLGSLMAYPDFQASGPLGFAMGRDVNGEAVFANIEKMPHLLVAGATGSGKSIFMHSVIISLLYKNSPDTLKLILLDPKRVELSMYEGLPHLVSPVVVENKKALGVFRWAVKEMERRYELLSSAGRRDMQSYNAKNTESPLPYILIVIDELADLMASYGREVEGSIIRLAQMARATGLHLILSTQRPSVEVITGLIKANITNRVGLQVASQIDSRTILDTPGAEKLLGGGDLLFISQELSKPRRVQGAYISEEEISKVADFIRARNQVAGQDEETGLDFNGEKVVTDNSGGENGGLFDEYLADDSDELYDEAVAVVATAKKASASLLQRRLKVGYARAARLLDLMETKGIIGPGEGAKPREVFLDNLPHQTE